MNRQLFNTQHTDPRTATPGAYGTAPYIHPTPFKVDNAGG
ncbi:Uncharacterised protein [Serratia rubidaea]|uniref:Uncharacterized protein n=1 Tax=Serratia rubidaea TaxID=61652 RepID=A0A3S4X4S7_SERRU|nr:Uncharacterised protein [Serratia rubidaea]